MPPIILFNVTQTSHIHDMDSFSDWGRSAGSLSTCTVAKGGINEIYSSFVFAF